MFPVQEEGYQRDWWELEMVSNTVNQLSSKPEVTRVIVHVNQVKSRVITNHNIIRDPTQATFYLTRASKLPITFRCKGWMLNQQLKVCRIFRLFQSVHTMRKPSLHPKVAPLRINNDTSLYYYVELCWELVDT